jgi:Putative amidoligase enzyme
MCQARSEGGRRCPVHRYESIAALRIAQDSSGMTADQVKDVFKEIRREGRHTVDTEKQYYEAYLNALEMRAHGSNDKVFVTKKIEAARDEESVPDGATFYALQRLHARAAERGRNLSNRLQEIAGQRGITVDRLKEEYTQAYDNVDRRRGASVPDEFTQASVREARRAGLPYDRSTVVALAQVSNGESARGPRRVTLEPLDGAPHILYGYDPDGGRVELQFHDLNLAYHNVPQEVSRRLENATASRFNLILVQEITGRSEFMYNSPEEAEADAHSVRCGQCGQFRAVSHTCPAAGLVDELRASGINTDVMDAVLEDAHPREKEPQEHDLVNGESHLTGADQTLAEAQRYPQTFVRDDSLDREISIDYREVEPILVPVQAITENRMGWDRQTAVESLSEEEMNQIRELPENSHVILGVKSDENGGMLYTENTFRRQFEVVGSYNAETDICDTSKFELGNVVVRPRMKSYEDNDPYKDHSTSEEEIHDVRYYGNRDFARDVRNKIAHGEYTELEMAQRRARGVRPDPNYAGRDQIKFISRSNAKTIAENPGQIYVSEIEWRGTRDHLYTDSQGYDIPAGNFIVHGYTGISANTDGAVETPLGTRSLRCNCSQYQDTYHCPHVDYVDRHLGALTQQLVPDPNAAPRITSPSEDPTGLMTDSLIQRTYINAIPATEERGAHISLGEDTDEFSDEPLRGHLRSAEEIEAAGRADPRTIVMESAIHSSRSFIERPPASVIAEALAQGDTLVPVTFNFDPEYSIAENVIPRGRVTGQVMLHREDDATVTVSEHTLKCTCSEYAENYDCMHVREMVSRAPNLSSVDLEGTRRRAPDGIGRVLDQSYDYTDPYVIANDMRQAIRSGRPYEDVRDERVERERVEREREEEAVRVRRAAWEERNRGLVEGLETRRALIAEQWQNADPTYADNPKQFFQDYEDALARKAAGEEVLTYATENVTDGICADEPGARAFGIELEFDIDSVHNRREALQKIGQELHEAGLTNTSEQVAYHSAETNGYATWSFEQDCTVDAELVSPLMKDTPEHWEQLRTAVEIINRNGGIATARTGSHVHVSTASYGTSTAKHAELLRAVNANEDTLYRLASDPSRGTHRGTQWCQPNVEYDQEYVSSDVENTSGYEILGWGHDGHNVGVNFEGTANSDIIKSNVEFRMWDGTLDPAVIQQQVKISAAMTEYADQHVSREGGSRRKKGKSRLEIGSTRNKEQTVLSSKSNGKHDENTFHETNIHVASFIDTMFRRKEDRAGVASLFAVTNWQRG